MELRSCSHLHFVQAIKHGLVTKVQNVYRGRPAFQFKLVKDLYGTEDAKTFDAATAFTPKLGFVDFPIEGAMDESLCAVTGERKTVKRESQTYKSSSKGTDKGARESDDFNFGNVTLQELKVRCKKGKRKSSTCASLSKEKETSSLKNQNHFSLQSEEDEYDVMEPLSCWKSRILKNKKTKKKYRRNNVCASSQNALAIVKFEEIVSDQDIFQCSESSPVPIAIKIEVHDSSYSDCKDLIIVAVDSSFCHSEPLACSGMLSSEEQETVNDNDLESGTSMIAIDEPDTTGDCVFKTGTSVITGEELRTNACWFEQSYKHMEHADSKLIGGEIMREGAAEVLSQQFSELSIIPDENKEDSVMYQNPKSDSPEIIFPSNYHCPVTYHDFKTFPHVLEKSQKPSSDSQVQAPEVKVNNSLQHTELNKSNNSCLSDDAATNDTPHTEARVRDRHARDCSSLWSSNLCLSPKVSSLSVLNHSPTVEEKCSLLSVGAEATRNSCSEVGSCIDEPVISASIECHQPELQHPPERLLSSRMTISPTSQKRLREALECTELDAEQYYRYARKLCYRKQSENKAGRTEGANQMKRAEVSISPKKVIRKPKTDNSGFHQNDKIPHPSGAVQRFSTGCTSIRSCSESAILFSQQQMRDIESITNKLAKELQSMRDIVEETLQSEVHPAASLKYNTEEMRIATQNAKRVEESARKSLSIMARDCNRFCKILKLAEKGSASSPDVVRKKRKIVFADEAGGKLCDVKTFEDDMSSFTRPKDENTLMIKPE